MNDFHQDIQPETDPAEAPRESRPISGVIPWLVSGALHSTAVMIMVTIVFISKEEPQVEVPPVHVTLQDPPEHKIDKPKPDFALVQPKASVDIPTKSETEAPIVPPLEVPPEQPQSEDQSDLAQLKGREDAIATAETGGFGTFLTMGAGPSGSGAFGPRIGGRKRAVNIRGGSKQSEIAVEGALRWFKRHQSSDGRWDAERYFQNCTEGAKCEPGSLMGHAASEVNTAMTAYALLCFFGAGNDHRPGNPYHRVVRKGLDYLLSVQKPDGRFGERNYEHAIATMAVVEALGMSNDPDLRMPAQKGVDVILAHQNQDKGGAGAGSSSSGSGLGWDYIGPNQRNDASVTGWNVMALKSAHLAGLSVRGGIAGSKQWLERAWKASNDGQAGRADWRKLNPYSDETVFSYTWPTGGSGYEEKGYGHLNMAPVGLACAVFLGHQAGDPMLDTLANWVMKHQTPTAYPCNTYYLYYNTLAMFQVNGDKWKVWNSSVRDLLVEAQRRDEGCLHGSWDWQGTQFPGSDIGRVLSTAYCTLSLEVYYRYELANGGKKVRGL